MIEVLKQALEALELALRSHGVMLLSDPPQDAWKTYGVEGNARQAITSLRQAIAELESQERNFCPRCGKRTNDIHTCTPPQRSESSGKPSAWVGLTDEDMDFLFPHGKSVWVQETVKIIEAKLKEKNT